MFKSSETDTTNLRKSVSTFRTSPQFDGFSKVVLEIDDDTEITVGSDTGRTLRIFCPWGTEEMANNILSSVKGFQYQPYSADGAILDPAAELMDGVTIDRVYSGIYKKVTYLGPDFHADLMAPEDEETNHEYPYKSFAERRARREMKEMHSELRITADEIAAEVEARTEEGKELRATLDIHSDQITAKVEKHGGSLESFLWELESDHWAVKAGYKEVFRVDKDGAYVSGEIRAKTGKIGGFEILSDSLSYNSQVWGGTNYIGAYLGSHGIQLGSWSGGFHVDNSGGLFANSGEFRGTVTAGGISYGGSDGYLSGSGLESGSVYGGGGGQIAGSSITTGNTSWGINSSLGNGDFAADVCRGYQTAQTFLADRINVSKLYFRGHQMGIVNGVMKALD